jgi:hypothetical protein
MKKVLCFLLLSLYFCGYESACAQTTVLPETAKIIPPETIVLLDVDNFSRMKAAFEKTNFYRLYKEPAMSAFAEDLKKRWREKMQKTDNKIAEAIISADMLPEGRMALALVLSEQARSLDDPHLLLISQWGSALVRVRQVVDEMVGKAVESGSHRSSEDYRGITIVTMIKEVPADEASVPGSYRPEGNKPPPANTVQPQPEKLHYCWFDDALFVCDNIDILRFTLAHIKGATSPALADDAEYAAGMRAVGPYHDVDFYINIRQIIKSVIAADAAGEAKTMIGSLGLDNVTCLCGRIGFSRESGISCGAKALLKIDGVKKGACKMLEPEPGTFGVPRFVAPTTCSLLFFNLNVRKAYEELANTLRSLSPQAAAWMYTPLATSSSPDEPGLKIKEDIIDHLGSQIVIAQSINKPFYVGSRPTESVFALAVNSRKPLEKSLSLLHSKVIAPDKPDARRELLGHTIYQVRLPAPPFPRRRVAPMQGPVERKAPQASTLAFTVTDTHLIVGVESAVEAAIRALNSAGAASVDSAKWFAAAKSAIPATAGLANLQDNEASGELSWRMMKESGRSDAAGSTGNLGVGLDSSLNLIFSQEGLDLFNFGLLPDFEAVRKHFGVSAAYGVSRGDGFFFEFKYLTSPRSE